MFVAANFRTFGFGAVSIWIDVFGLNVVSTRLISFGELVVPPFICMAGIVVVYLRCYVRRKSPACFGPSAP